MVKWRKTRIGQFLKEREGRYDPTDKKISGLERLNKIDFSGEIHLSGKGSKTDMIIIEPGDLVISGINVAKGAIAVHQGENPITATIHYSSYEFDKEKIDIEYFKRFVKSQAFIRELEVRGGIKTEIKPKHFLPIEIDLPDIDEQRSIVSFFRRVEDEMGELDSEISTQAQLLHKLRQAILQEAIEGKLTAEWRKQNPKLISGENHASKLLEKIRAEKDHLIREGKIRKEKPLPPITDDEKPFSLPDGWVWCRLGEIIKYLNGYAFKSQWFKPEGVRLVRNINVSHGYIDWSEEARLPLAQANEFEEYFLNEGDIVISLDRPIISTGLKVAKIRIQDMPCLLLQRVLKVEPVFFNAQYLFNWINSGMFVNGINPGRSIGIPHVSHNEIINLRIPLPPIAEQQAIVECVEKRKGILNTLEAQVAERNRYSELLMQSALREAFSGKSDTDLTPITPQQVEEKAFFKRSVLASHIINQSLNDAQFGDTKFEKLLYLADCYAIKRNLDQNYLQQAAGPYDNKFTHGFWSHIDKQKWFKRTKQGSQYIFKAGDAHQKSKNTYNYFSDNELQKVNRLIGLFKKHDYQGPEIVSTLYAVWNNRIIEKREIEDAKLIEDFYAWDAAKKKYPQERLEKALAWMRKESIVPDGWGKVIEKTSKRAEAKI